MTVDDEAKHESLMGDIMNGYIAFWHGKKIEIFAASSYAAQVEAARIFKTKKSYDVTVVLAEKDGQTVTHNTAAI